jgi:spermidine synthase
MSYPPSKWYHEYITADLYLSSHLNKVLYSGKTAYQQIEIVDTIPFGRCLILDGRTQSSEADEFVYHEALVQPGLTSINNHRSVFIAGGGEGATLREVLSHSTVERVIMVDLDQKVVELSKKYLPNHHRGAFDDPRVSLIFDNARSYLEAHQEQYDFIVIDIPDPLEAGPAYLLYTQEFYQLARQRLATGGLMVVQSGPSSPLNYHEVFTAIHNTISSVFVSATPYQAYIPCFGSLWSFILAGERYNPSTLSSEDIDTHLETCLTTPLRFYDGSSHSGLFSLPKYLREALAREEYLITDAKPLYAV